MTNDLLEQAVLPAVAVVVPPVVVAVVPPVGAVVPPGVVAAAAPVVRRAARRPSSYVESFLPLIAFPLTRANPSD